MRVWEDNDEVGISVNRFISTQVLKNCLISSSLFSVLLSSTDIDWYHEIPDFHSMYNKSEPTWEWEDEQGFSALRHSGKTDIT